MEDTEGPEAAYPVPSRRQVLGRVLGAMAVAAVVIAAGLGLHGSDPAVPPPTEETTQATAPLSLAANPFLLDGDVTDVGPYASLRHSQGPVPEDQRPLPCISSPVTWGALQAPAQLDLSDLDATYVEHVLRFGSDTAAAAAVQRAAREFASCDKGDPAESTVFDRGPDTSPVAAGLDATLHASRVTTPTTDGEIAYYELAAARLRNVVVVLEWTSQGNPNNDDTLVWTDARLNVAVRRAIR